MILTDELVKSRRSVGFKESHVLGLTQWSKARSVSDENIIIVDRVLVQLDAIDLLFCNAARLC